jgi:HD-GYP domain-containing protein (c-di-GMP phosphodiesterase class II)
MNAQQKLEILTNLGNELNHVKDLDILLEKLLTEARHIVNADAGSIYVRDKDKLRFSYCQNDTLQKKLPEGEKLVYSTFELPVTPDSIAGYAASTGKSLHIPDVYHIGNDVPYSFDKSYDIESGYRTHSMLTIPLLTRAEATVGVIQIINAKDDNGNVIDFCSDDEKVLFHFADLSAVTLERAQMTRGMILRMIKMAGLRDPKETGTHVIRVGAIAAELWVQYAKAKNLPKRELEKKRDIIRMAAMLHDVGKVGIPDAVLKKPGRFTPDEFAIMKEHCVLGARLFLDNNSDFDAAALEIALNHHERWDGAGYPGHIDIETGAPLPDHIGENGRALGKKEEEIPLFGRIVAIADVYDALLSKRVYKEAWTEEDTFSVFRENRGTQFDPELVDVFFDSIEAMRSIRRQHPDI